MTSRIRRQGKAILPLAAWLGILLLPHLPTSEAWAGLYLVKLSGGGQYLTTRYWAEGVEIRFVYEDGIIGVPQEAVIQVDDVSDKVEFRRKPKLREQTGTSQAEEIRLDTSSGTAAVKPQDSAEFLTYVAETKALEEQAMAPGPLRTKPELMALGQKGMELKNQMLVNQNIETLLPLVARLDDVLERLEENMEQAR
jgi:hypothetical protein